MNFASDNWAGAHPAIMAALQRANEGYAPSYGGDALTKRVEGKFAELFEREVAVFFVATGGAANALALSQLSPSWGMILCHEESHIQMDECGAPEFFTGGAKLLPIKGLAGKLSPDAVKAALAGFPERPPHGMPAKALSLTQATECGTVYSVDEVKALCAAARSSSLKVHMDGARFANALATLECSPADITWKAGVDVLSFGGTKNGCLIAEAVVFFDPAAAADFMFRRKRAAQLFSKMRFIAAQFDAYFEDGLWLDMAAHANAMARRLSEGLSANPSCKVWYPPEANEVFVSLAPGAAEKLRASGATFYPWVTPGDPAAGTMQRLICSWATAHDEVDRFIEAVRRIQ
ncbi:MAG: low specificity L-threonine aldolase [Parvularculaceae bacterium]|nr:low specificity L-threonine aldolase [Parvularculaceae bacterium]